MTDHDTEPALQPLPETGVRRVLCVVAHPDDMEYGTSAAVAAWTGAGVEVTYLLLTRGEAGMAEAPEKVAPLREKEQRRACEIVGVSDLRMLDHPDGMLEYGLPLRSDIARVVRQVRPDLVLTANFDFEAYGGLNQADHRVAGLAVIDAVRDAANPWVFRDRERGTGALAGPGDPGSRRPGCHPRQAGGRGAGPGSGRFAQRSRRLPRAHRRPPRARPVHPRDPARRGRGPRRRVRGAVQSVRPGRAGGGAKLTVPPVSRPAARLRHTHRARRGSRPAATPCCGRTPWSPAAPRHR